MHLTVLADRITAARGLYADIELAPSTITIHITRHDAPEGASLDDLLILLVLLLAAVVTYGLLGP